MAYANKQLHNPKTGQSIRFIRTCADTGGLLLEMETTYQPHSMKPAPHHHPHQTEDFEVLQGELSVEINGKLQILHAGDTLHIPAGSTHRMWNQAEAVSKINWKVQPALHTEYLLETAMGLAAGGKSNAAGTPGLLDTVLLLSKYNNEYRVNRPPRVAQQILILLLKPLAWLLGYNSSHKKYMN